ncbi:GDSL-type esterase/lipase family protein [Streptococcus massiliensis]|uniref:Esterase n=1 Tax=Streptococcus massiliensis TaxID=313439 RepID=A0A380KZS4_9STRE|nr:GDSL-type esterase/lipase family protein [Streptococcus massiliensis]SUN77504.1 esterase [Streptococcus massiliensis]
MRIHITGDSLAARFEGYEEPILNYLLKQKIANLQVINTAVSGNNTRDLLARLEADILSQSATDYLFLLIGANDLATHKQIPLVEFKENLLELILRLREKFTHINLCIISPPPVDESKQQYRKNSIIEEYVKTMQMVALDTDCAFLNLYQLFLNHTEENLMTLMTGLENDGLHFGLKGYQILADAIYQKIQSE